MPFTEYNGGSTLYTAQQYFQSLQLESSVTLEWPLEARIGVNIAADIIDVYANAASLSITLPDARKASTGQSILLNNIGGYAVDIYDGSSTLILTIEPGTAWQIYLSANTTAGGQWRSFQAGASTASVNVATIAGQGLTAISNTLAQSMPVITTSSNYSLATSDRAFTFNWTGGVGQFDLPAPATAGFGWFVYFRNSGSGNLTIAPASGTIDGSATKNIAVAGSCTVFCDGSNYFSISGSGTSSGTSFDYVTINVAGSGTYVLSGAQLNRVAYKFTGVLTGNRTIQVPATIQEYWVDNSTTGAYSLYIKTAAQAAPGPEVLQGNRGIFYCDGADVIDAESVTVTYPIAVALGGTGATTAAAARTNLGSTTVGDAVFVATTSADARTALGGGAVGSPLFTAATTASALSTLAAPGLALANVFTAHQELALANAYIKVNDTSSSVDNRAWALQATGNSFQIRMGNDAWSSFGTALQMSRVANQLASFSVSGPATFNSGAFSENPLKLDSTGNTYMGFLRSGVRKAYIQANATSGLYIVEEENLPIVFGTNGISRGYFGESGNFVALSSFAFGGDVSYLYNATEVKLASSSIGSAGPQIRARWDAGTTNRYLQIGTADNGGTFTPMMETNDSTINFRTVPTYNTFGKLLPDYSAFKSSQTSRTSTTTKASDPDLQVYLPEGSYEVEMVLRVQNQTSSTQGFWFDLAFSGVYSLADGIMVTSASTAYSAPLSMTFIVGAQFNSGTIATASPLTQIFVKGQIIVTTGGTLTLQWAQFVSSANATVVGGGSFLVARKLA